MLLSGPPSSLIFFEPSIEVNTVVHQATAEFDGGHAELREQRDANTEVFSRLLFSEAANRRQAELVRFHFIRSSLPDLRLPDVVRA